MLIDFLNMGKAPLGGVADPIAQATLTNPSVELTDMTFFVDLSKVATDAPAFWAALLPDAGNLIVQKSDGTQLPVDIVLFNQAGNSGFLAFKWTGTKLTSAQSVKLVASSVQLVQPAVDATFGQYNAYDANWLAFYPQGGAEASDRTVNQNTLTLTGLPVPPTNAFVTGTIGVNATNYQNVDTTNNFGTSAVNIPATGYPASLIAVAAKTAAQSVDPLGFYTAAAGDELRLQVLRNATPQLQGQIEYDGVANENATTTAIAANNNFHHYAGIAVSDASRRALLDGTNLGTNTNTAALTGLNQLVVGKGSRSGLSSTSFSGSICLVQFHTTNRADGWVAYQNAMLNQATFYGTWSN